MFRRTAATALVLGLSAAASADTVNLDFTGHGAGRTVGINFFGGGYNSSFAGQMEHTMSGGTGVAAGAGWSGSKNLFCAELVQNTSSGNPAFTIEAIRDLPDPGTNYGVAKEQAIWDLCKYAGANAAGDAASNDYACAFQLMVWEILYDGPGSLSLSSGNLKANSLTSQAATYFTTFVGYIDGTGTGSGVYGLGNVNYQDQIYFNPPVVVPLPMGAMMGAAGLGLAGLVRLRKRA